MAADENDQVARRFWEGRGARAACACIGICLEYDARV